MCTVQYLLCLISLVVTTSLYFFLQLLDTKTPSVTRTNYSNLPEGLFVSLKVHMQNWWSIIKLKVLKVKRSTVYKNFWTVQIIRALAKLDHYTTLLPKSVNLSLPSSSIVDERLFCCLSFLLFQQLWCKKSSLMVQN